MEINKRLQAVRKSLDMTQQQFGEKIGLAQGYVTNLENSRRDVSDKIIKLVSSVYNVSETWLKTGEGEMFDSAPNAKLEQALNTFKDLKPEFQDYVMKQIEQLLEVQKAQDENVED